MIFNYLKIISLFLVLFFSRINLTCAQEKKTFLIKQINSYKAEKNDYKKDTIYINLINKLTFKVVYSNYDSVVLLSNEALELSNKINYKKGKAAAYINLALSSSLTSNQKQKYLDQLDEAIQLCMEIKADSTLLFAYNVKALQKLQVEDYEEAYKLYNKAIPISIRNKDVFNEIKLMTNLATLFLLLGDIQEALPYYEKALILGEKNNSRFNTAVINSNLGYLQVKNKNFEKALYHLNKSIPEFQYLDRKEWLSFAYITKGDLYLEKNNPEEALKYFELSKKSHEKLEDKVRKADLLSGIAKAHLQLNDYQNAEVFALEGLATAEKQNYQAGIISLTEILYKVNKVKKNDELALKYLEKLKTITDSSALKDKKNALTMLKAKTSFQQEQDKLKQATDKALAQQENYIMYSLMAVAFAILVSFYIYKKNNLVNKLNTELNEKAITLEESQKSLLYANETQEKLFSIISHDLKSPINGLKNLLLLIKVGSITPSEFLDFVPKLYNDVDAMSFTLNNLLSWSKSQMNGFVNHADIFNLKEEVQKNIQLLQENANQKQIRIENKITENAFAFADVNQFNLVVRNLLNNGIKFTKLNGEIIVSAKMKNEKWEIAVSDNGVGITPEVLKDLFTDNSALKSTYGTNNEKGTGLGLLLCKEMVEKNKGEIGVNSTINEGTTFYFTIPIDTEKNA
ncbi:MAG: tetratricopeptide repeat-containing sensor histidine kinase [Cellulophaga sp.]|nr:tetratricopeptide repeat-containing sensor histidine kinase [Cellulophaga sp.]